MTGETAHAVRLPQGELDLRTRIAVMAIVNRTPDSFYDRGRTFAPGPPVPVDEELRRVVPVVRELAPHGPVSVDTFQPDVARAAIAAGAAMINDTTGLRDPQLCRVVADSEAAVVIAHSVAAPRRPLPAPQYDDVVGEVAAFLVAARDRARAAGIPDDRIVLDPGHDLNKNTRHSLELTRRLDEIVALGSPVLVALSNKDFIGETLDRAREDRLAGSLAAAVWCAVQGARIVRVHDVAATVDAMRMLAAIRGWREPALLRHNVGPDGRG